MPRVDREGPIHRAIVQYLRAVLPTDCIVHHSANEGVRGGRKGMLDGARRKAMGQVAGWPDITVLCHAHAFPALFFEVKAPGGYASPAQAALHDQLKALGYLVAVVRSVDDVRAALRGWSVATKEVD